MLVKLVFFYLFNCVYQGLSEAANTTVPSGQVHCLQCERVAKPDDCITSVTCPPGEICMSEQYITTNGLVFYDLGCKLASVCSAGGFTISAAEIEQRRAGQSQTTGQAPTGRRRRQSIAVHVCEECCEDDFCNNYLCGGHESQLLKCAGCDDMRDMSECAQIQICQPHEVCYIEERITDMFELHYTAGCARQRQCDTFKDNQQGLFDPCFNCCNSSFCNVNCTKVIQSTLPPTTPTSTITSTITMTSTVTTTTTTTASTTPTTASTTTTADSTSATTPSTTTTTPPTTPTTEPTTPTTTPSTTPTTPTPSTTNVITSTQTTMIPSTICPTFPPLSNVGAPQVVNNAFVNLGCGGKDDIVFLVDSSTHVLSTQERVFQLFTNAFVSSLQVGPQKARVGYAYYNSRVNEVFHLEKGSDPDYVDRMFSSLVHYRTLTQDRSYLGYAINHVLGDMYSGRYSRSGAKKHLVILTGNIIDDINLAVAAADRARSRGIDVMVVAVGNVRNIQTQLHRISSSPSSQYFLNVDYFGDLQLEIESFILSHCRGNNPLPTIASDPCAGPKLLNNLGCGAREDITLILDRSGSIHRNDWVKMQQFIQKLVGKFDVSPRASRIGMMTFNNHLDELIHFKDFSSRTSLLNEINYKLSHLYPVGNTMTNLALERTLQWYKQGSSPDAIKVAVIFTDGKSSSKLETLASALELQRNNVTIFVVGIGSNIDLQEQMILASDPDGEHMLNVQSYDGLLLYMEYLAAIRCRDLANKSTTTATPSSATPHINYILYNNNHYHHHHNGR